MSDDLERRLQEAFHRGSLPPAPASLVDGLQRVPDAPVRARSGRLGRSGFGLLAAAVILAVGGAIAITGGSTPRPAPAVVSPATPASSVAAASPGVASVLHLEFVAQPVAGVTPSLADVSAIVSILKSRAAAAGIVGAGFAITGLDTVIVELPGITETEPMSLLAYTGDLAFVPLGSTQGTEGELLDLTAFPPLFRGDEIASASVGTDQNGRPAIDFVLTTAGAKAFGDYTAAHIGDYMAIAIDGVVISAPVIQSAIPDGNVQITGGGTSGFDAERAATIVAILDSGALPFPLKLTSSQYIERPSPSGP